MDIQIANSARKAALELFDRAGLKTGQTVAVGCSTSEIAGHWVGTAPSSEIGAVVFDVLYSVFSEREIFIAAQCCEHLNRALVIEREAASGYKIVNAVPTVGAGGSFATAAYNSFFEPVALEQIEADAGLDIGGTLIAMHLKRVAVPLRLETVSIGKAAVMAARTRPPQIGGIRASYDESLF